tara:strand:- start:266 stop:622 length:357 start_codon:yes stop_codon:yes gene_type:complete
MSDEERNILSPLNEKDIEFIDSTNLSLLEKHHVRLLAHCLETLKSIPDRSSDDTLPNHEIVLDWLEIRYGLAPEDPFLSVMGEQLDVAAIQLEKIAVQKQIAPLALTLQDLIGFIKIT